MVNKYNMTKEDNIFFAKRKLVDNIYKSANMEGIAVPVEKIGDYMARLIKYYETNDMKELKKWIYDNCIDGVK